MRGVLFALTAFAGSVCAHAQTMTPVGVDLFGEAIVKRLVLNEHGAVVINTDVPKERPGYPHTLITHDGAELRGALVELTNEHVVWSRPDLQPAIRFPRSAVRSVRFRKAAASSAENESAAGNPHRATIKLGGSDWLFGETSSPDGKDFSARLKDGAQLAIPRSAVEWIHVGNQRVPAARLLADPMSLEGWKLADANAVPAIKNGSFEFPAGCWIAREFSASECFEVAFEIPPGSTDREIRLWLQPGDPSPESYGWGTVELFFGEREIQRLLFLDRFERKSTALSALDPKETARYRVFYDRAERRVAVQRNGLLVGDWKFPEVDRAAFGNLPPRAPAGLCFDREHGSGPMRLGTVHIRPWDGVLPGTEEQAGATIRIGDQPAMPMQLDKLTPTGAVINGQTVPLEKGLLIQLARNRGALPDSEALLQFGEGGELTASGVTIRDSRLSACVIVSPSLNLPVDTLLGIRFPRPAALPAPGEDALVFRNGDTLRGKLLSASKGEALRWKNSRGDVLAIQTENVAGARLRDSNHGSKEDGAFFDLLTGERARGELLGLNEREVRLRSPLLGERTIARRRVAAIFPHPKFPTLDAGGRPKVWLGLEQDRRSMLSTIVNGPRPAAGTPAPVYLDGVFIAAGDRSGATIHRSLEQLPEKYELRCEVTDSGGISPGVNVALNTIHGTGTLQIQCGVQELQIFSWRMNGHGPGSELERQARLPDKLAEHWSRRELRMFVDTRIGAVEFMVDGVHVLTFGGQAAERIPGIGSQVSFSPFSDDAHPQVLANVSLRPWNGELPRNGAPTSSVALTNGDVAFGPIGALADGKVTIGEGADLLEVPLPRVMGLEFGTPSLNDNAVARARLTDGTAVNFAEFSFDETTLRGMSATFGALELPRSAVAELVLSPSPARTMKTGICKPIARENTPARQEP